MNFRATLILFHALVLTAAAQWKMVNLDQAYLSKADTAKREVLYLPSGTALDLITLGYRNLAADIIWFNTIDYFGRHYQTDRNYHWLGHMCGLVTDLNPRARDVFEFCGLMLAWEAEAAQEAVDLMTKAIEAEPDYWRYQYMRGFTYMYFLEDAERARDDFTSASKTPEAPDFLARLAARKMALSDPLSAIEFLESALQNTTDPAQRGPLENRLREMRHDYTLEILEAAVEHFKEQHGRLPVGLQELVNSGALYWPDPGGFHDYYGGEFYLDLDSGTIKATGLNGNRRRSKK